MANIVFVLESVSKIIYLISKSLWKEMHPQLGTDGCALSCL